MASDLTQHKIGWIGTGGRMGYAMAERLAKAVRMSRCGSHAGQGRAAEQKRLQDRRAPVGARRLRHRLHHGRGRLDDLENVTLGARRRPHARQSRRRTS